MKKFSLLLGLLCLGSVLLSACGAASNVIKIGVVAELTGDMPVVGASCKNAAEMAVNQINTAGGLEVAGKKYTIELFIEDNKGRADQSAAAVQKLVDEQGVVAIIGPNASRYAIPAAEIAENLKVPLITPWSTSSKTTLDARTGAAKKYVFRACFVDSFQGRVVAKFALEQLKATRAAVLYDESSDYNTGIAEYFKQTYEENGGTVVAYETYTAGNKDFSTQLTRIKDAGAEVIFLPNYYYEVPLQIQQAHRLGIEAPFLGSDSWGSAELIQLCGGECEGYFFSTHYAPDAATPIAIAFIDGYKTIYGQTPDDVAALTYDSFGLLWAALKNAGKTDSESIRNALATIPGYEGVTGNMQLQEGSGDPIKSAVILQIKNGTFVWYANANP